MNFEEWQENIRKQKLLEKVEEEKKVKAERKRHSIEQIIATSREKQAQLAIEKYHKAVKKKSKEKKVKHKEPVSSYNIIKTKQSDDFQYLGQRVFNYAKSNNIDLNLLLELLNQKCSDISANTVIDDDLLCEIFFAKKIFAEKKALETDVVRKNNAFMKFIIGKPILVLAKQYQFSLSKMLEEIKIYLPTVSPKTKVDHNILNILLGKFENKSENQHNYLFQSLEDDLFVNREIRKIDFGIKQIQTNFSDLEAFSLCKGLNKAHANSLAFKYFANVPLTDQDYFDAHMYAMVALEKYGSQTLSLCLALPPHSFKHNKVYKAFSLFQKIDNTKPSISFFLKNPTTDDNMEQFCLTFGLKEIGGESDRNVIYLRKKKSNQVVAILRNNGTIEPTNQNQLYRSQLNLFFTILDNPRKAFVTFGNSTGTCSICGRELTKHQSAMRGIGPICEKFLNRI